MTGSATATVETLTAEVRVLMVGSRQVTLSVYRQLDRVPFADLHPMGRVRDGKAKEIDEVQVVGISKADGTLVSSVVRPPTWRSDAPKSFDHWYVHMRYRGDVGLGHVWKVAEAGQHHLDWQTKATYMGGGIPKPNTDCCPDFSGGGLSHESKPRWETVYEDGGYQHSHNEYLGRRIEGPTWQDPQYKGDMAVWEWLDAEATHRLRLGAECDLVRLNTEWTETRDQEVAQLTALQEQYDRAAGLSLIVLAGLR